MKIPKKTICQFGKLNLTDHNGVGTKLTIKSQGKFKESCCTAINLFMSNLCIPTVSFIDLLIVLTGLAGPVLIQLMPVVPHNFQRKLHFQHWHFLEELLNKYPAGNQ